MAIAVLLNAQYDIETFDGLVAYITAHLELDSETAAQVPTFIRKAEYRLNRLVVAPQRETTVDVATVASTQTVSLPTGFRQLRTAHYVADAGYPLAPVTLNVLHSQFTDRSGAPQAYAIANQSIYFGPTPDAAYTVRLTYIEDIPPLSSTNQTNWLLASNADAYVYATLWQAAAWLEDLDAATAFRAELMTIIDELNLQGNRYRNSAPMRLRSPVVV